MRIGIYEVYTNINTNALKIYGHEAAHLICFLKLFYFYYNIKQVLQQAMW